MSELIIPVENGKCWGVVMGDNCPSTITVKVVTGDIQEVLEAIKELKGRRK